MRPRDPLALLAGGLLVVLGLAAAAVGLLAGAAGAGLVWVAIGAMNLLMAAFFLRRAFAPPPARAGERPRGDERERF